MLIFTGLLAFYLAWNLGANDVANSMGTSVGSKAVSLRQALIIAGVMEFAGAILFGRKVASTLATRIVQPEIFAQAPQILLVGMVAVLVACGVWMNIATLLGLPVSSSHAIVGAMAGFGWVAAGIQAVDWPSIGLISLTWVLTPLISGAIAAGFYVLIKQWILEQPHPLRQLNEWTPWLSGAFVAVLGLIVLPNFSQPLQRFLNSHWDLELPSHTVLLGLGAIATAGLTFDSWRQLERQGEPQKTAVTADNPTPATIVPPRLASSPEFLLARFQVLSACSVAFAHGSNDVGNAVAPLAVIVTVLQSGSGPTNNLQIPLWVLVLGGSGIVAGLAVWGKRVISTVGEGIIPLRPSSGFCAEFATATTVLLASHLGFPVSTSHALVGGVVGVGLMQAGNAIQCSTLQRIALAWVVTIPIAAGLGALGFALGRLWVVSG